MQNIYVSAVLLLAISLFAVGLTFAHARREAGIGRRHFFAIAAALCLLAMLGLVPQVREAVASIRFPAVGLSDGALGAMLVSAVVMLGIGLGLVLVGKKRLDIIARDTVERLRIAAEERRDPALRMRNACVRKYQRVLEAVLPAERNTLKPWRHGEMVSSTLRELTDEEIQALASFLDVLFFDGRGPVGRLADFLKAERSMMRRGTRAAEGHLIRLNRLVRDIQREATDT